MSLQEVKQVWAAYFSATGNTAQVVKALANELAKQFNVKKRSRNFTLPKARETEYAFQPTDLVVFGTPVYAGRVPNKIMPFIRDSFVGNGALVVPVVTFGNRSYDDGLIELCTLLETNGFHTIAAVAQAARHAFSDLAMDRPNHADMNRLNEFAIQIADKINGLKELPEPIIVTGNNPVGPYYTPLGVDGKPTVFLKAKPKTDRDKCDYCGACIRLCPMGDIAKTDPADIPGLCIKCQACVKVCHTDAKFFDDPAFLSHKAMLQQTYGDLKQSEFFI